MIGHQHDIRGDAARRQSSDKITDARIDFGNRGGRFWRIGAEFMPGMIDAYLLTPL